MNCLILMREDVYMGAPVHRVEYFLMLEAKGGGEIDLKVTADSLESAHSMADSKRTELMYRENRPVANPSIAIYKREVWEEVIVEKVAVV